MHRQLKPIWLAIGIILALSVPQSAFSFTTAPFTVSPTAVNIGTVKALPGASGGTYAFTVAISGGPTPDPAPSTETAQFVASTDAPWLSLSASSGTSPSTLTATATVSATMADGTYTGNIQITSGLDPSVSETIPVSITVIRSIGDLLLVSPSSLEVTVLAEGAGLQTFPIQIANADPSKTTFTWNAQTDVVWLSLSQTTGTGNASISVSINPANLPSAVGADPLVGTVTFRSSLSATPVTLEVTVSLSQSTELAVFPSQLFWTVEKSPDQELSQDAFNGQTIQIYAGTAGWSASHNLAFASIEGELFSTESTGTLTVTPTATTLDAWGYGRHEGSVTVSDRLNQLIRRIPVIVEIRQPGATASLPSQQPEIYQISPYFSMVEVVEAGLLNLQLQVPRSLAYYPSQTLCQAAGGSWNDPDGLAGNLDEYCSLNQRAYVLVTLPEMFPGQIIAWTPKSNEGVMLVGTNGVFFTGTDRYSYADGPIPYIPFGPFQLLGFQGTGIISLRIGPTLAAASEIQRIQLNIRNLSGKWRVTENYGGESYTYNDANLLNLSLSSATGTYSGTWGSSPVTVSTGDGGISHFYRIGFSENGFNFVYDILSLTGGEMKGRWLYSWSGGTSSWETFRAQRVSQPFSR